MAKKRAPAKKPKADTDNKGISDLAQFARAFPTEKQLRDALATLLSRMGREDVRIVQGSREKGKDLLPTSETKASNYGLTPFTLSRPLSARAERLKAYGTP